MQITNKFSNILKRKQDEVKIFKSACRMCHGGCGALLYVKKGKLIKIQGDPGSPLSQGTLCPKGHATIDHVYNPTRLKYPLQRVGNRGEGKWQRISWPKALGIIAQKLRQIKGRYGAHCVAIGQGTGRHHYGFVIRFAHEFGSPNWTEPGLAQCLVPRSVASVYTYGGFTICDYYGPVNPKCILVWGHNPINTGPDGELAFRFLEALKKGSKVVCVDPRASETVKKSDVWLQIRPGTDDALALAMLNIIINEELYDQEFVNKWTIGFEQLVDHIQKYSPEWAERVTWIQAKKIEDAARIYAKNKPACIEWGVSIEHTPNSFQTARAIALLRAITGNLDIPGGDIFGDRLLNNLPLFRHSYTDLKVKPLGADRYKLLGAAHFPTLLRAINHGKPYPIKALLVFGNNSLVTYANSKKVYEALMKLDFLVVTDIYMTPTAELADIVLPAATWPEIDQIVAVPFLSSKAVLVQQKVVELYECKQDEWILLELAKRLNLPLGSLTLKEIFDYQLRPIRTTFNKLKKSGHFFIGTTYKKHEKIGFKTPSRKVEVYSNPLKELGYQPLPSYLEPPESPISNPKVAKEFPLILTTGSRSKFYFHSEYRQIPSLRKMHPDPILEINPQTAKKLYIENDDWVYVETLRGKIKQKAKLTEGIDPRVVNIEHGWWFPEEADPEHGVWTSNANVLTDIAPPYDPAIGTYQLRALLCKVYKAH